MNIFDQSIIEEGRTRVTKELKKGLIIFSPLAQGLLSDRYINGIPENSRIRTDGRYLKESALSEEKLESIRRLNELACRRGQSLAQMALAWVLNNDAVTSVLIGASRPSQIEDNVAALQNLSFTEEELKLIQDLR
jgi:L-glyceraldehyde 3-phosphate reductase